MRQSQNTSSITIAHVPEEQKFIIGNLLQIYLHDFSEFAGAETPYGQLESGTFAYPHLDTYWQDASRVPLLIRADGHIAGFALICAWSSLACPLDHAVAEFFIARKFRRTGVGATAAKHIFFSYPGRWEVPVRSDNAPALMFWPAALSVAAVGPVTAISGDGARWTGPVYCFDNRSTPPGSLGN